MLFEAIEFAAAAHRGQYRKASRVPYLVHPLGVMRILLEGDCDETLAGLACCTTWWRIHR